MGWLTFKTKARLSLVGGFILHLLLGCGYMWGNLNLYFTSYFRNREQNPTLTTSTSVIFNPVLDFLASFMIVFAVPISNRLGAKASVFLTGLFMSAITFLTSYIDNPYVFLGIYAGGIGSAYGFLWMIPLNNIYAYYPHKKGLCSGFILSGIGVGTATGNLIAKHLINPDNYKPTRINENESYFGLEVSENFPSGMRVLGMYFVLLTFAGSLLTFNYNKVEEEKFKEIEIIRSK
jgi:hypothetical protein